MKALGRDEAVDAVLGSDIPQPTRTRLQHTINRYDEIVCKVVEFVCESIAETTTDIKGKSDELWGDGYVAALEDVAEEIGIDVQRLVADYQQRRREAIEFRAGLR